jgi:hypothetical protein
VWRWFFFTDDNTTCTKDVLSWFGCGNDEFEKNDNILSVRLKKRTLNLSEIIIM